MITSFSWVTHCCGSQENDVIVPMYHINVSFYSSMVISFKIIYALGVVLEKHLFEVKENHANARGERSS